MKKVWSLTSPTPDPSLWIKQLSDRHNALRLLVACLSILAREGRKEKDETFLPLLWLPLARMERGVGGEVGTETHNARKNALPIRYTAVTLPIRSPVNLSPYNPWRCYGWKVCSAGCCWGLWH